ncbi:hypothetical protein CRG98_002799 [Punica granatum]|uniref:Response regulatory domain-containing protein n=1 Tax=Punica granatum TaxID=22663 RepID=A0A2I0L854_PUNGR|nr:hypothetical protein CRG98_002799 [Punica granatum]
MRYFGFETQVVSNGMEAMELFKSGEANFDIVLVELIMPHHEWPRNNRARETLAFLAVGGDEYMEKPLNHERLAEILTELDAKETRLSTLATRGN